MASSRIIAAAALAIGMLIGTFSAFADTYPVRHVRIITAGAGTFHDIVARLLAQRLSERWGQAVIVENQPAAGLTIGATIAAKAAPDGYTLFLADRTCLTVAPHIYTNLHYDAMKDFRPITLVARVPALLAIHPSVPANNLREFVGYARQQSDPILFASAGVGTMTHLAGEQFAQLADIKVLSVQYKGGTAAVMATLSGEARFTVSSALSIGAHLQNGALKALAVLSLQRTSGAPDVPTSAEAGLPGLEAEQWVGMLVPAGTPDNIVEKLNRDITEILRSAEFQEKVHSQGAETAPGSPTDFGAFIASESTRLGKLVATIGLRME
jgi:tripartite-type tricarboxylate transporter receptor subunit TctC